MQPASVRSCVFSNRYAWPYASARSALSDVLLLVEVSDTTLHYDRDIKLPLYATHAIPEVWLIDLKSRQLQCSRKPVGGRYTDLTVFNGGLIAPR
jgi:Uma2 family endonuclease